jgi:hypothetical protein|nr:MAG TPA: hypothetical protein [Crassvirales sp.]
MRVLMVMVEKLEEEWGEKRRESDALLHSLSLFIVKEQVTNDFAIVKSTKQYANLTNNPTPFVIIQNKGIVYR